MRNKWKVGFWVLFSLVITGIILLSTLILMPIPDKEATLMDHQNLSGEPAFNIKANKEDLNRVISHYIETEFQGPIDYSVQLKDDVEVSGTIPFFTSKLDFFMTFEPKAMKNGGLLLKNKTISLGQLDLPVSRVLKIIDESYNFPEWVNIQPKEEMIYISLQKMELKSNMKMKAKSFNLEDDNIEFLLLVPVED
ncbi:YpmS family protein [Rossellomorea sp. BNER]|uniref:YpmS family protein n=1 Tax=Rossellomorea sp. BNER TaxID=2962031 RepID=UPI003AF2D34A|nr:YpmS family protein [Rossellomorea sp. BNER]